jgi:hypothetical protein
MGLDEGVLASAEEMSWNDEDASSIGAFIQDYKAVSGVVDINHGKKIKVFLMSMADLTYLEELW